MDNSTLNGQAQEFYSIRCCSLQAKVWDYLENYCILAFGIIRQVKPLYGGYMDCAWVVWIIGVMNLNSVDNLGYAFE